MQNKKELWIRLVGEEWYNFYPKLWESQYMENTLAHVSDRYSKTDVFPDIKNIFRAFKLCPLNKLKVVILGQDPYSDGSATGLAFANRDDSLRLRPSLFKIRDTIERGCYDGFKIDFDITLEEWAEQGVLLLNTALTVEKYNVTGHIPLWSDFTKAILLKLNDKPGLHYCLWGRKAQEHKVHINPEIHYIHEAFHPAYAARNNEYWECDHFRKINEQILKNNGEEEIIAW